MEEVGSYRELMERNGPFAHYLNRCLTQADEQQGGEGQADQEGNTAGERLTMTVVQVHGWRWFGGLLTDPEGRSQRGWWGERERERGGREGEGGRERARDRDRKKQTERQSGRETDHDGSTDTRVEVVFGGVAGLTQKEEEERVVGRERGGGGWKRGRGRERESERQRQKETDRQRDKAGERLTMTVVQVHGWRWFGGLLTDPEGRSQRGWWGERERGGREGEGGRERARDRKKQTDRETKRARD